MSTEHKTPKKNDSSTKKKLFKVKKVKNSFIIGGLIAVFAIAGIIGGVILFQEEDSIEEKDTLILGVNWGPQSFDPLLYPSPSIENFYMFDQVAEGLFDYDSQNVSNPIVPNLAKEYEWSIDLLNLTCTLREGINFHDGTSLNATAVKWTIDRVYRLLHLSSFWIPTMWLLSDEITPIINETVVIDEYTVRFVLNHQYIPLLTLLFHPSSYILSPTSTPYNRLIDFTNETLTGTGPYILESFFYDHNTTLIANSNYWNCEPSVNKVIFKALQGNHTMKREEMLSGKLSFTYGDFDTDEQIALRYAGNTVLEITSSGHWYISMDYERVNITMRKAISYAFNYTYFLDEINSNPYVKLKSYIPFSFPYSNWTAFEVPDYDIIKARQTLKDINWPGTSGLTVNGDISPGNEWELIANSSTPLATYNTSATYDSVGINATSTLIAKNLKQIGVKVELLNMSRNDYYTAAAQGNIDFAIVGYYPDFNDPHNVLDPLFSNSSYANYNRVNDPIIQTLLQEGIDEIDQSARRQIYYDLQQHLIEEVYPYLMLYTDLTYHCWNQNVRGITTAYKSEFSFLLKNIYLV